MASPSAERAELLTRAPRATSTTSPTLPFKLNERLEDPVTMYMSDLCTVLVNLAGTAGINLPNGFGEREGVRLPTGLQLICAPYRDVLLLRIAQLGFIIINSSFV